MKILSKQILRNNKANLCVSLSPEVLEQRNTYSLEVNIAFDKQVVEPLLNRKQPGKLVNTSVISNKILYYVQLNTGELVFYEVTFPRSPDDIVYYSIHYIIPKRMVDELERNTVFSTLCKNLNTFTAPIRHFILANKIFFFAAGFIGAFLDFLF